MTPTSTDLTAGLVEGVKYRIEYRSETQIKPRQAVMVYLGRDGSDLLFSARPVAGTQHLPVVWLRAVEQVDPATEAYVNRVLPG